MNEQLRWYYQDERLLSLVLVAMVMASALTLLAGFWLGSAVLAVALVLELWAQPITSPTLLENQLCDAIDARYAARGHDLLRRVRTIERRVVDAAPRLRAVVWLYVGIISASLGLAHLGVPYATIVLWPVVAVGPAGVAAASVLLVAAAVAAAITTAVERGARRQRRGDLHESPVLTAREISAGLRRLEDAGAGLVVWWMRLAYGLLLVGLGTFG